MSYIRAADTFRPWSRHSSSLRRSDQRRRDQRERLVGGRIDNSAARLAVTTQVKPGDCFCPLCVDSGLSRWPTARLQLAHCRRLSNAPLHPVRHDQPRHRLVRPLGVPRQIEPLRQLDLRHQQEDRRGDLPRPVFERDAAASPRVLSRALSATSRLGPRPAIDEPQPQPGLPLPRRRRDPPPAERLAGGRRRDRQPEARSSSGSAARRRARRRSPAPSTRPAPRRSGWRRPSGTPPTGSSWRAAARARRRRSARARRASARCPASRIAAVTARSPAAISAAIIATRSGRMSSVSFMRASRRASRPAARGRAPARPGRRRSRRRATSRSPGRGVATSLTRTSKRVVSDQSRASPKSVMASARRAMTRTGNGSPSAGS